MGPGKIRAIFLLASIPVYQLKKIPNGYLPEEFVEQRKESPWYEVTTRMGVVTIGWRKRVLELSWKDIPIDKPVTQDNVTQGHRMVHAYSYGDAVNYLANLQALHTAASGGVQ